MQKRLFFIYNLATNFKIISINLIISIVYTIHSHINNIAFKQLKLWWKNNHNFFLFISKHCLIAWINLIINNHL